MWQSTKRGGPQTMTSYFILKSDGETFGHLTAEQFNRAASLCTLRGVEFDAHYINTDTREHRVVQR